MISSGDSNGKRRRGSRARKILLIAMMAVVGIILLTWTECGCTVEQKQGAAAEVAEEQSAGNQNTGSQSTNMSASETALDKARQAGKPVLLNFHSTQCYPCIEIEKQIKIVEPEYDGKVEFIIVDVYDRSEQNLCYQYQIEIIPTTFFIDAKGQVREGREGVIQAASLKEILNNLIANR
ncbi:MAG: hypothetical protein A2Y75_00005 [Candidatus Solincola sediminis]|uniref:Thioredoxin domain-containing protein n=1 Tax=Candidatus Solincola sediminis TaxID=1797199 RepID=A0A1F2WPX8_9ACTN|nr:MAG: hypothetical protein A2Y75_00005 [Candidatus Solincola sediminis]